MKTIHSKNKNRVVNINLETYNLLKALAESELRALKAQAEYLILQYIKERTIKEQELTA